MENYRKIKVMQFLINYKVMMILGCLLILPLIASAERPTIAEMDNVCQNWMQLNLHNKQAWQETDFPQVINIENIEENDQLLARIYILSPIGFIIVPGLKELPPVMAYVDECSFDPEQDQGMRTLFFDILSNRLMQYKKVYGDIDAALPDRNEDLPGRKFRILWDRYSIDPIEFTSKLKIGEFNERSESVGPLLTTAWHDGPPYNLHCPIGYNGYRTAVGCTAVACAQIFYYWQWPQTGNGSYAYYWGGDNSCTDSSTAGGTISADFSDPYIYDTDPENIAELNFEVGVSLRMDYGFCGSGAYLEPAISGFPQFFKYKPIISQQSRNTLASDDEWYYFLKKEIDAGRPMPYKIDLHIIVCDGYRDIGGIKYIHLNFGLWGEIGQAYNTWFAIDAEFCPPPGCNIREFVIYNLEPAWVWPTSDTTFGFVPLDVNLTTETEFEVTNWYWDFGDGNTLSGDYPATQHTYNAPGIYDLTVDIESEGKTYSAIRPEYIIAIADSLSSGNAYGKIGDPVEIGIFGNNTIPLNEITIPITYSGAMGLKYDSCSIQGCRTEDFLLDGGSIGSGFLKYEFISPMQNLFMEPGSGLLLKIYFTIISGTADQTALIQTKNIGSIYPRFKNNSLNIEYNPITINGSVSYLPIIGDADGNRLINILDVVYIISLIYKKGPEAVPPYVANVNGDELINILDVVYLINFIYKGGPDPVVM